MERQITTTKTQSDRLLKCANSYKLNGVEKGGDNE